MKQKVSKLLPYFVIMLLIFVGIVAIKDSLKAPEKVEQNREFVTRSAVDSTALKEFNRQTEHVPVERETQIPWTEITAAIVSLSVGFGSLGFKASHTKINGRLDNIDTTLQSVIDQKNRDNVDNQLIKIEQDAAALVDDEKVKALIEGIGSRTRSFTRDVMQSKFDEVALEKADLKIGARTQDCKHQVHDLNFSNYFETEINKIRSARTKQLHVDLTRLMKDRIHNSKYQRFGELICRFQNGFMRDVIKLYYESKG